MDVAVIGVPSSAGAYGLGQELAPAALRRAGLLESLASRGHRVTDLGDLQAVHFAPDPDHRRAQNIGNVLAVARDVADAVEDVRRTGRVPLVLGGDCTITIGVVAGICATGRAPAVAYVDGDLDVSTPATTRSGILDAMGVAHLLDLDGADEQLAGLGDRRPLLHGPDLALVGHEDDPDDSDLHSLLEARGVHRFPAPQLREDPHGVGVGVRGALPADSDLIVHLDVDVIDSVDCPLAHFPHFNTGAGLDQVAACTSTLADDPRLAAFVVTEVNPHHDPDGTHLSRLVALISTAIPTPSGVARDA